MINYQDGRNDPAAKMAIDMLAEGIQQNGLDGRVEALFAQFAHRCRTVAAVSSALFRKHRQLFEGHFWLARQLLSFPDLIHHHDSSIYQTFFFQFVKKVYFLSKLGFPRSKSVKISVFKGQNYGFYQTNG